MDQRCDHCAYIPEWSKKKWNEVCFVMCLIQAWKRCLLLNICKWLLSDVSDLCHGTWKKNEKSLRNCQLYWSHWELLGETHENTSTFHLIFDEEMPWEIVCPSILFGKGSCLLCKRSLVSNIWLAQALFLSFSGSFSSSDVRYVEFQCVSPCISHWYHYSSHHSLAPKRDLVT